MTPMIYTESKIIVEEDETTCKLLKSENKNEFVASSERNKMNIIHFIVFSIIFTCICNAQTLDILPKDTKPIISHIPTEEEQIKYVIGDVLNITLNGKSELINRNLSDEMCHNYSKNFNAKGSTPISVKTLIENKDFIMNNVKIILNKKKADVEFSFYNKDSLKNLNEKMVLEKSLGQWKITSSSFFMDYIAKALLSKKINASSNNIASKTMEYDNKNVLNANSAKINNITSSSSLINSVNSLVFSNSALFRTSLSITPITRSLTQSYFSKSFFSSPYDGKVAFMPYSGQDLNVITDQDWHRIILGSSKGQWLKSYGDNSGDSILLSPTSVAMNTSGDIFVIADFPRKVYRLKYNDVDKSIRYMNQVPIQSVIEAKDVCIDWLDMYFGNSTEEYLWIADMFGSAIYRFTYNGTMLKKYTKIKDISTGEEVVITHPTKIIVNYNGGRSFALIDSDKKRVIIVRNAILDGVDPNTIESYGGVSVIDFSSVPNVSLSSICQNGWASNNGLLVSDKGNGMINIISPFDNKYLGSVQSITNGQPEWTNPQILSSTWNSNSNIHTYNIATMDKWDDTHGIKFYLNGADLVNPTVNTVADDEITINASIFGLCEITTDVYASNGLLLRHYQPHYSLPQRGIIASFSQEDFGTPIGKYRVRFGLLNSDNSDYPDIYKQQPLYKDVWIALPLSATISNPALGNNGQISLSVTPNSGSGEFSYRWYKQIQGSNVWNEIPNCTLATCTLQNNGDSFTIKCIVTDNFNGNTISLSQTVIGNTKSGYLSQSETWTANTLTGDIYLLPNIALTIKPGGDINLNGHSISSYGGTIIIENGAHINGAYIENGENIQKLYPSIQAALYSAYPEQTVIVPGSHSLSNSIEIPDGITLQLKPNVILTIPAGISLNIAQNGLMQLLDNAQLNVEGTINVCESAYLIESASSKINYFNGSQLNAYRTYLNLAGIVTVNAGANLNFLEGAGLQLYGKLIINGDPLIPGANLFFNGGGGMQITGKFEVNGDPVNKAIIDFVYPYTSVDVQPNGIQFPSGTPEITLSNCIIKNAYCGIYTESYIPVMNNCTFEGCTEGIFLNNLGVTTKEISNCRFINNGEFSMYIYNTAINIHHNVFKHARLEGYRNWGLRFYNNQFDSCYSYAALYMVFSDGIYLAGSMPGHNVFTNNYIGLYCNYLTDADLGTDNTPGLNSMYKSRDNVIFAQNGCTIWAKGNWWNRVYPEYPNFFKPNDFGILDDIEPLQSHIYYTGLIHDPNIITQNYQTVSSSLNYNALAKSSTVNSNDTTFFDSELNDAIDLFSKEKYNDAADAFLKRYQKNTNLESQRFCLSKLDECYWKMGKKGASEYINENIKPHISKNSDLYIQCIKLENRRLLTEKNYDKVLENLIDLKNNFKRNVAEYKHTLYELWHINHYFKKNKSKASEYLTELEAKYPDDELVVLINDLTGRNLNRSKNSSKNIKIGDLKELKPGVTEYELFGNYPNPFNPTTTISYALPFTSDVEIRIYDMMGKQVKTFNVSSQAAGYHDVVWNSTNSLGESISSGIYFYKFNAKSLEGNFKVYEKISKMLFLK